MAVTKEQILEYKRANPHRARAMIEAGAAAERERWRSIDNVAVDLGLDPIKDPLVKAVKASGRYSGPDLAALNRTRGRALY